MVQIITLLSFAENKATQRFLWTMSKGGRGVIIVMAVSHLLGVLCLHYQAVFYLLHKADHMFDTMSATLAHWHSSTVAHWNIGTVTHWHPGTWNYGTVAQWHTPSPAAILQTNHTC